MPDQFQVPRENRYFEDYVPGRTYDLGTVSVSEREIIEFAWAYDRQPMHVDPEAAAKGRFGGLIASGWHTTALAMRLFVDDFLSSVASMASPGVDELRWPNPVRPDDTIRVQVSILESIPSRSKADRGAVRTRIEAVNQHDQKVLSLTAISILGRRESAPHTSSPGS